jgi:preprotein translocase subunit YajC
MVDPSVSLLLLAQAQGTQPQPDMVRDFVVPLALMGGVFYLIWLRPLRAKQRRQQEFLKNLKSGDKVIVNPGIFGTIVAVEEDSYHVRIDDKTKIRVLKNAVAGLQAPAGEPIRTETK